MTNRADTRRGGQTPRNNNTPQTASEKAEAKRFVQIKTVVLMSDAWRDCEFSARCAFIELSSRLQWASGQPEPLNNGRLWLSRDEWKKADFATATVSRATKQLIKVGLLYRTRAGGIGRGCSEYALTCYPLTKDTSGLFCSGFRKDAWAKYVAPAPEPEPEKTRESKVNRDRFKNDSLPPENGDYQIKSEPDTRIKFEHQESESTNLQGRKARASPVIHSKNRLALAYASPHLIRRQTTSGNGQLRVLH